MESDINTFNNRNYDCYLRFSNCCKIFITLSWNTCFHGMLNVSNTLRWDTLLSSASRSTRGPNFLKVGNNPFSPLEIINFTLIDNSTQDKSTLKIPPWLKEWMFVLQIVVIYHYLVVLIFYVISLTVIVFSFFFQYITSFSFIYLIKQINNWFRIGVLNNFPADYHQ